MPDWVAHNSFVRTVAEGAVRGGAMPSASQYRLILCNGTSLSRLSSIPQILSAEVAEEFGYSRQSYQPGQGTYDNSQQRYEFPLVSPSFGANGGSYQYDHAVLWANGSQFANKVVTTIDPVNNQLIVPSHGLSNGNPVVISAVSALATGIPQEIGVPNTSQVLFAKPFTTNAIELYTDSGLFNLVDLQDVGTGTHTLRYASGYPVLIRFYGFNQIANGQSQSFDVNWAFFNAGDVNGV